MYKVWHVYISGLKKEAITATHHMETCFKSCVLQFTNNQISTKANSRKQKQKQLTKIDHCVDITHNSSCLVCFFLYYMGSFSRKGDIVVKDSTTCKYIIVVKAVRTFTCPPIKAFCISYNKSPMLNSKYIIDRHT